ncbi:MAG: Stk1 family PASTA domain-containing Ser/Thr kinase [Rubrobacter sp.]|nr:Stk1 family PASTA domain-containing Ser/Thr kinase [Rubrobacter sp.]
MPQLVDNRYRIVRLLGSGGMADVYLAHDGVLDRDVALKVMSGRYSGDEEFVERFRREAQSAAALSHPNIVSIYDRGESEEGTYYIAMEYISGGTLKDRIRQRGALPARTAAEVALQIAEALRAAHDRGVIHRDIKPHNILITESGDLKVTDFGIARAASSTTMTRTGSILGTAHYISPEQAMGKPAGPQSDLYSLGIVLYEMLTGQLPYDADSPIGIAMKHVNGVPPLPSGVDPSIPESLDAVTARLLSKSPDDRYGDDAELIEDLERISNGSGPVAATAAVLAKSAPADAGEQTARISPINRRAAPQKRPRRVMPVFLAVAAAVLLALLGWVAYDLLRGEETPTANLVAVPDLEGLALEDAQGRFGESFDIAVEDREDSGEPVDTILSQDPEPDDSIEEGAEISVVVSGRQMVEVPGVVGESQEAARSTLSGEDFEVGVETEESSAEDAGLVVEQSPSGGDEAELGSEVELVVGEGPADVEVPDLSGLSVSEAEETLEAAELELGDEQEAASDEVPEDEVTDQDPSPGSEVEPGTEVDVTVSTGPEPISVPAVVGLGLEEAQQNVVDAGLDYALQEEQSAQAEGTVISTDPAAGEDLEPGSTVLLTYSVGQPQPEPQPAPEPQPEPQPTPEPQPAPEPQPEPQPTPEPQPAPEPQPQPAPEPQPQPEPQPIPEPAPAPSPEPSPGNGGGGNGGSGGDDNGGEPQAPEIPNVEIPDIEIPEVPSPLG